MAAAAVAYTGITGNNNSPLAVPLMRQYESEAEAGRNDTSARNELQRNATAAVVAGGGGGSSRRRRLPFPASLHRLPLVLHSCLAQCNCLQQQRMAT